MSLHVCSYVVCSRVPKSYVEVCSSSLQHKTCRLYNYKEKQGPRKKYEQNNRASLKSRYEFIHYSCALIYLLISFFPPSPLFLLYFSFCLFPILFLLLSRSHSDKETYSNYNPSYFHLCFFLRHAHYSFSHTSFELSRSLMHSNAHVLTYTPLLSQSLIFRLQFFSFFILSRYSNARVVTRGRASMSISLFLEYATNEEISPSSYIYFFSFLICFLFFLF